jgi:hypothetical protein
MGTTREKTRSLVAVLEHYKVENVVTNACWSAYTGHGQRGNSSRILLRKNRYTRFVAGMWGKASGPTISTYLDAFYESLLVVGAPFEAAAQAARRALREDHERWPQSQSFRDDILCIHYSRESQEARQENYPMGPKSLFWRVLRYGRHPNPPRLGPVSNFEHTSAAVSLGHAREPVKLELIFLQLELSLLRYPGNPIVASDAYEYRQQMLKNLKGLGEIWVETNFVTAAYFYHAADFVQSSQPKPHYSIPPISSPRRLGSKQNAVHIIEEIDDVFNSVGDGRDMSTIEQRHDSAKVNLGKFVLDCIGHRKDFLILASSQTQKWWKTQTWTGKVEMFWEHGMGRTLFAPQRQNGLDDLNIPCGGRSFYA